MKFCYPFPSVETNYGSAKNLEYSRKLLTQLDNGAIIKGASEPFVQSKAIILAERKRIRNVQDVCEKYIRLSANKRELILTNEIENAISRRGTVL